MVLFKLRFAYGACGNFKGLATAFVAIAPSTRRFNISTTKHDGVQNWD